jgi:hypothetical protein
MRGSTIGLVMVVALARVAPAATVDVTSCPVVVPAGAVGVVQGDLDCLAGDDFGYVVLGRGAALELNGHTLTYHQGSVPLALVHCESSCTIRGPGALASADGGYASVVVADGSSAVIEDVSIGGMVHAIIAIEGRVKIRRSNIAGQQWGVGGVKKAVLEEVTVSVTDAGGYCIGGAEPRSSIIGTDVTLTSCHYGIQAWRRVKMTRLTAAGQPGIAVHSQRRLVLIDSSVTGSGIVDLLSARPPVLVNTACDTSGVDVDGDITQSWGVCAND